LESGENKIAMPRSDDASGGSHLKDFVAASVLLSLVLMVRFQPTVRPDHKTAGPAPMKASSPDPSPAVPAVPQGLSFTFKRVLSEISTDRVLSVGGGLSFFALLAIFPAITTLVSIFGLFADPAQVSGYLGGLTSLLPGDAANILVDQAKAIAAADATNLSFTALFSLLLALWSANGGTKSMVEALNVAYGVKEGRSFVKLNLFSLGLTLAGIGFVLALFITVALLPSLLAAVWLGNFAEILLLWGRWPAIFCVVMLILAALYHWAPNRVETHWRWITPGAVLAAVGLLGFSALFAWYATNFGTYNQTYGSLGAVVALMTWMWLSAVIVLVGAELNAELDRQSANLQKKGPDAAPSGTSK
jgi:membrane protein